MLQPSVVDVVSETRAGSTLTNAASSPELLAQSEDALEVGLADAAVDGAGAELGLHRIEGRPRERPEGARIEIRDALEHGEERPRLLDRHSMRASTGA